MSPRNPPGSRESHREKISFDPAYGRLPPRQFPEYDNHGYVPVRGMGHDDLRNPHRKSRSNPRTTDPSYESQRCRSGFDAKMYGSGNAGHSDPARRYDRFRDDLEERRRTGRRPPLNTHFGTTSSRYQATERAVMDYNTNELETFRALKPPKNPQELRQYHGREPSKNWWHQGMEQRFHKSGKMYQSIADDRKTMHDRYYGYELQEAHDGHDTQATVKQNAANHKFHDRDYHRGKQYY